MVAALFAIVLRRDRRLKACFEDDGAFSYFW